MILQFFRNLRAKIIGAKVGNFVSLDRRGNFVDSGYSYQDLQSPLPEVTSSDNGKVLKVISGEWNKGTIKEVPSGGQTGQVLTKTSSAYGWENPPKEIPDYTSADTGKVLLVDVFGNLMWSPLPSDELPSHGVQEAGKYLRVATDGTLYWDSSSAAGADLYIHRIHIWKTNASNYPIADAYIEVMTNSTNSTPIGTTLTDLDDFLGSVVGNAVQTAHGLVMPAVNTGYNFQYLKFDTNSQYFALYYYPQPTVGVSASIGLLLDPSDTAIQFEDAVSHISLS